MQIKICINTSIGRIIRILILKVARLRRIRRMGTKVFPGACCSSRWTVLISYLTTLSSVVGKFTLTLLAVGLLGCRRESQTGAFPRKCRTGAAECLRPSCHRGCRQRETGRSQWHRNHDAILLCLLTILLWAIAIEWRRDAFQRFGRMRSLTKC